MLKKMMYVLVGAVVALGINVNAAASEVATTNALKVLSVGNSFSANAHKFLPKIAKSMGKELVLRNAFIGGCSLERHVRHMKEHEADPTKGNVYHGGSLKKLLELEDWDIVTIQQVSHESINPESFEPYGTELIEYIKKYAPNAEIVIHQTWGYAKHEHRLNSWGMTPEEMTMRVVETYKAFGEKHGGLRYIPCGEYFAAASKTPIMENGKPASIYARDGYHASHNGEYFLGCIWYKFLFNEDVAPTAFKPDNVSKENAEILRNLANSL